MSFDLENRCLEFSKQVIKLCKTIKQDAVNKPLINQVVRSAGSIGANYIEANESLSKKDFIHRVKIARKEAKETAFWLENLKEITPEKQVDNLLDEATQLKKILSSIVEKSK
jgi:four helix bundle protein